MKHESPGKAVVKCLIVPVLMALLAGISPGQEVAKPVTNGSKSEAGVKSVDAKNADDSSAEATESGKKPRKKPRGRLPMYFSKVVTEKQRSEIYAIQAKFNEQITTLQEQLDALAEERDAAVEEVLTDEQRTEVEKARAARRAAQKSKAADETDATGS